MEERLNNKNQAQAGNSGKGSASIMVDMVSVWNPSQKDAKGDDWTKAVQVARDNYRASPQAEAAKEVCRKKVNSLDDTIAAGALPSASPEFLARGAGAIAVLGTRFKTGAAHPQGKGANADAHTDMDTIYARITFMVPGLDCLSQTELKKEDISELDLLKQPQLGRARKTGCSFYSACSAGFRRNLINLLKWVEEKFTPAEYKTFHEEVELLRQTCNLQKAATTRTSRDAVGRADMR